MTSLELRGREVVRTIASDRGATWCFRIFLVLTVPFFYIVGRRQWFTRDDWALILSRENVRQGIGWKQWLFMAQDGHWLTIPTLLYHALLKTFGLGSYWPFLVWAMLAHVGAVLLAKTLCTRLHVSAWTTTLVYAMLLVFGTGFDNIVFAIQISYNLSLLCFLAQLVLVDHEGDVGWHEYTAAVLGVIGVMSSGFGPIFMAGVTIFLILRRRWKALAITVVPQALAYGWWLIFWSSDNASNTMPGGRDRLPAFLARGVSTTFEAMVAIPSLAGVAILAALAISVWSGYAWRARALMITLWSTVVIMFLGIAWERIGFGVEGAASSRYVHVAAIIIAPVLALAFDQLGRLSDAAHRAGRMLLFTAFLINFGALRANAGGWARQSRAEQDLFALVAGYPDTATALQTRAPSPISPDVMVFELPTLVADDAFVPRVPTTPDEIARVRSALGLPP